MLKTTDRKLHKTREERQKCQACKQSDRHIRLADRLGGVQICRPLGGQTHKQTERRANFEMKRQIHRQVSKQAQWKTHRQRERGLEMGGIFTQHLMMVLLYFAFLSVISLTRVKHTHAYRHRHTAKQSSAYPGMPGWVPSGAREKQHAASECLHTDMYIHTHTNRKKKWERALTSVTGSSSGKSTYAMQEQNSHMLFQWCETVHSVFLNNTNLPRLETMEQMPIHGSKEHKQKC